MMMSGGGATAAASSCPLEVTLHFKPQSFLKPYYLSFKRINGAFTISSSSSSLTTTTTTTTTTAPPGPVVAKKRKRYRKLYPGEIEGIAEEMRFVAMRLRNDGGGEETGERAAADTWYPTIEGFLKYLVDSHLVFETLERIIDHSADVSYAYFRKTGLERSASLSRDLEWFKQQGIVVPKSSSPGITYAAYLDELAEKSAPSFLCHLYNINFAHITGGHGIGRQVCEKLLKGRELEFYSWERDVSELLRDVREKLNKLGEHWSRDVKNRCLKEATKSFRFSGQILRLIIL